MHSLVYIIFKQKSFKKVNILLECGISFSTPNIRIVGGLRATPHSWPAQVLIVFNYKGDFKLTSDNIPQTISQQFFCGGTLISTIAILTAAHCVQTNFDYYFNGQIINLPIQPNKYYNTWNSMFSVYIGIDNIEFIEYNENPKLPTLKLNVSSVIVVSIIKI